MDLFRWTFGPHRFSVPFQRRGTGATVLLLPALSTASTQQEMDPLARELAALCSVVTVDWPGFGQASRPPARYRPALLEAFLSDFVEAVLDPPVAVVAAGHAAGYVMRLARARPALWTRAALVCPTWRGPLPTAMGEHRRGYRRLEQLVRLPGLGPVLYYLNTTRPFLRLMYRRHVYGDAGNVTPGLVRRKQQTARAPGARFASAAFVTGALDPARSREAFLSLFEPPALPVTVVIGDEAPARSRNEMEAVAQRAKVHVSRLPGALGLHEEHPASLKAALSSFLQAR